MDSLKIGICDDDLDICRSLAGKIRGQLPDAEIRLYTSGEELLAAESKPDVLFLDILLTGVDGMSVARKLRAAGEETAIVLISGSPDHVFEAFDVDAVHYLLKPFDPDKLREVIRKSCQALRRQNESEPQMVIRRHGERISVRHRNILWAEVFNRTVVLHTTQGELSYYGRLRDLETELGDDFFRTHRAYLINCRYVDSYDARSVHIGTDRIPIAKTNYAAFVQHYMHYVRRQGALP